MSEQNVELNTLIKNVEDLSKTSIDLAKLKAIDKTSNLFSGILSVVFILGVFMLFFLFANIALALYINSFYNNFYVGFLYLSSFYFLLCMLFIIFRKQIIKTPIANYFVKKLLNE